MDSSKEAVDLFARSTPKRSPVPATPGTVLPFRAKQEDRVDQDESCCGCYFMAWGKQLRRICCHPEHPGPIEEKAFCLNGSDTPSRYIPFDEGQSPRLSREEMVAQNYT